MQPSHARSRQIDLMRIACASLLFYFHIGLATHWPLSQWGEYAVGTFIYLIGYCAIAFSRTDLSAPVAKVLPAYLFSRLKALYPTFAIITLMIYAGSHLHPSSGRTGPFSLSDLASNLLMLNQYVGQEYFSRPMWFVPFALQAYLLLPFLCRTPPTLARLVPVTAISLMACGCALAFFPDSAELMCRTWSPVFHLQEVYIGVLLAYSVRRGGSLRYPVLAYIALCLVFGAVCSVFPHAGHIAWAPLKDAVVFAAVFAATYLVPTAALHRYSGVTALLGKASLPFFLGHSVLMALLYGRFHDNVLVWIGYFVLAWLGSVVYVLIYDAVAALLAPTASSSRRPVLPGR